MSNVKRTGIGQATCGRAVEALFQTHAAESVVHLDEHRDVDRLLEVFVVHDLVRRGREGQREVIALLLLEPRTPRR